MLKESDDMKEIPVLRAFLDQLIDYAGLFPPAKLELNDAITNYSNYIGSSDSWMLGPFVLPVRLLESVRQYKEMFIARNKKLRLSAAGTRADQSMNSLRELEKDYEMIKDFIKKNEDWATVDVLEIPLPQGKPSKDLLNEILSISEAFNCNIFCEIPLLHNDWKKRLIETLDEIEKLNFANSGSLGVKIRTGGIKAELVPSPDKVAKAIALCRDRKLRMKFTAGLHHPIRMYRNEINAKMHGFLNVFMAGMFSYKFNLDETEIEEILRDEEVNHFLITADELAWKNLSVSCEDVRKLREVLCSFGSCSFDEPKDELKEIVINQEVIR